MLESFGQDQSLQSEKIDNVKEFIRTVVYSGKVGESYVRTRVRLYKEMKSKSSSSIPPDPDSVEQAIREQITKSSTGSAVVKLTLRQLALTITGGNGTRKSMLEF